MSELTPLLILNFCLISGIALGSYFTNRLSNGSRVHLAKKIEEAQLFADKLASKENELGQVKLEIATLTERTSRIPALEESKENLEREVSSLKVQVAEANAKLSVEQGKSAENIKLLEEAKVALSNQFKSLASDILDEKSRKFSEQNQTSMDQIVTPLKDRINEFKEKVEAIHVHDVQQQAALKAELGQMKDLNLKMSEEAHGLAMALKGQAKMQGKDWKTAGKEALKGAGMGAAVGGVGDWPPSPLSGVGDGQPGVSGCEWAGPPPWLWE